MQMLLSFRPSQLNLWTVELAGFASLAGLGGLASDYQGSTFKDLRGEFSPFGEWFCSPGTHFCTPSQFFEDPMDPRVSKEGTSGARVGFPLIFDEFQGPLWDMFLSTWLIFQRLEATEFQHLTPGGFSWCFSLEFVLKFDGEMCWNHDKYKDSR